MKKIVYSIGFILSTFSILTSGCKKNDDDNGIVIPARENRSLISVASSTKQWTGVAVSKSGRIFVNYPNWNPEHTLSVAELKDSVNITPYPDVSWNTADSMHPGEHFVCVQAVFIDKNDFLWILDPANPQRNGEFLGVVEGGPKLLKVDLQTNKVIQKIAFSKPVITGQSYLNDVRIDETKNIAYITDSNEGAIVVVDLTSGSSRRLLSTDPSTKSENIPIVVEGNVWRNPDGTIPVMHSDGIALSPDRTLLYWRPLTGRSLYRISTNLLTDPSQTDSSLKGKPVLMNSLPPSDGIIFGNDGKLYMTSIEQNAIMASDRDGTLAYTVAQSADLKWPDSFSNGPDGYLYVTTSQIHIKNPTQPYKIFKFKLAQ